MADEVVILHCQTDSMDENFELKHAASSLITIDFFAYIIDPVTGVGTDNCAVVLAALTCNNVPHPHVKTVLMVNGTRGGGGAAPGATYTVLCEPVEAGFHTGHMDTHFEPAVP